MVTKSPGMIPKALLPLFLIGMFTGLPADAASLGSRFLAAPIDYRFLDLYQLAQNRYHCPSGACPTGSSYDVRSRWWKPPDFLGSCDSPCFFGVSDGPAGFALLLTLTAIAAGAIYLTTNVVLPYPGAASLTAIELPQDSPWRITGYNTLHGYVVRYSDLGESASEFAVDYGMFDPQQVPRGRFLLINQENWWGVIDYPVHVDITLTHRDEWADGGAREVTVTVRRKVTNGLKAGAIATQIVPASGQDDRLIARTTYPQWLDFSSWYHKPARVMIDFHQ